MNMVISADDGYDISSVVFTCTSTSYATAVQNATWVTGSSAASGSTTTITVSPAASSVTGTFTGTAGFTAIDVTYAVKSTKQLVSIALSGDMTNKSYSIGDSWDSAGLVVTATYDDTSTEDVTNGTAWTYDPSTISSTSITSVDVTASYSEKTANKTVTGITVTTAQTYLLVSSMTSLVDGDKVVIANATGTETYAMSSTQNSNNRGQVSATVSNSVITPASGYAEFTLGIETLNSATVYTLKDVNGYLYAASSSNNYLKSQTTNDDNGKWAITITDGVSSIVAQGTNTRNTIKYNSSNSLFSCYASGQVDVSLYYKTQTAAEVASDIKTLAGGWDNPIATDSCASNYAIAKTQVIRLSSEELSTFQNSSDTEIASARATYVHWCAVNGDSSPYALVDAVNVSGSFTTDSMIIILVVVSLLSVTSIGAFFFYKKRKENA